MALSATRWKDGLLTTKDGAAFLTVATTRPETMLGDTAVAVHPDDERYKHLIGGSVESATGGPRIPIIADDYVDHGIWYRLRQRSHPAMTSMTMRWARGTSYR